MINNHNHKHTGGSLSGGPGINTALNRVDVIVFNTVLKRLDVRITPGPRLRVGSSPSGSESHLYPLLSQCRLHTTQKHGGRGWGGPVNRCPKSKME